MTKDDPPAFVVRPSRAGPLRLGNVYQDGGRGARLGFAGIFVGLYWVSFALKSTIFSELTIEGLFYPFYLGFVAIIVGRLLWNGLYMIPSLFWAMVAFYSVIVYSFIGYDQPLDGSLIQKIVTVAILVLVVLTLQTTQDMGATLAFGAIAGLAISGWILVESATSGFEYRGGIEVNQNIVAFILGLSVIITICALIWSGAESRQWRTLSLVPVAGLMIYAHLLLASRGMTVAIAVAVLAMVMHVAVRNPRVWRFALLLAVISTSLIFLPGGAGLLQRFEGESVGSAGDRTPIWAATVAAIQGGDIAQLSLGHGFEASQVIVRRATGIHTSTHNAYLAILFDYGAVGLLAFLGLHVLGLVWALTLYSVEGTVATGLIITLLGANLTTTTPDDFAYWLALGTAFACVAIGHRARSRSRVRHFHGSLPDEA